MRSRALLLLLAPLLLFARSNPFVPLEAPDHISHSRAIPPAQLREQNLSLPPSARLLKSVTLTHQNMDGSIDQISTPVERLIDHNAPVVFGQPSARDFPRQMGVFRPVEALEGFEPLQLFSAEDILKIRTTHTLKNSFFLPEPSRIVLDFAYPDPIDPVDAPLENDYFERASIESHSGFFRLILTLKTHYPFTIEPIREGYLLGLN
jgi:hypothetical protein